MYNSILLQVGEKKDVCQTYLSRPYAADLSPL